MNRVRKLILNTLVIICVLFLIYYFGGFYFSKETCDLHTMRSLYVNETTYIMEFSNSNYTKTIYANPEEKTMSIVGSKRIGFWHQTASSSTGHKIDMNTKLDTFGSYSRDFGGMITVVYRNDSAIDKVEVCYNDGFCVVLDDWKQDFAGVFIKNKMWQNGIYKAYDNQGNLIAEISY